MVAIGFSVIIFSVLLVLLTRSNQREYIAPMAVFCGLSMLVIISLGQAETDFSALKANQVELVQYEKVDLEVPLNDADKDGLLKGHDATLVYRDGESGPLVSESVNSRRVLVLNSESEQVFRCTVRLKDVGYLTVFLPGQKVELTVLGTEEDMLAYFGEDAAAHASGMLQLAEK